MRALFLFFFVGMLLSQTCCFLVANESMDPLQTSISIRTSTPDSSTNTETLETLSAVIPVDSVEDPSTSTVLIEVTLEVDEAQPSASIETDSVVQKEPTVLKSSSTLNSGIVGQANVNLPKPQTVTVQPLQEPEPISHSSEKSPKQISKDLQTASKQITSKKSLRSKPSIPTMLHTETLYASKSGLLFASKPGSSHKHKSKTIKKSFDSLIEKDVPHRPLTKPKKTSTKLGEQPAGSKILQPSVIPSPPIATPVSASPVVASSLETILDHAHNLNETTSSWHLVNWQSGGGLLSAIRSTTRACVNMIRHANSAIEGGPEMAAIAAIANLAEEKFPSAAVAIKAGKILLSVGAFSQDVTHHVKGVSEEIHAGNFKDAAAHAINLSMMIAGAFA